MNPPEELLQSTWDILRENQSTQEIEEGLAWKMAITQAYRAGADQELEACLLLVGGERRENLSQVIALRNARRPKPPSLKEQALKGLKEVGDFTLGQLEGCSDFNEFKTHVDNIHRALGALPND
jgi:hypothetical protein